MSNRDSNNQPYKILGDKLRSFREIRKESLEEASGAVELEPIQLQRIEEGKTRPPEDTLHVLIHHFDLDDVVAEEIWSLAGYSRVSRDDGPVRDNNQFIGSGIAAMMIIPIDSRIVYSDSAHVAINNHGVVMTFIQSGPDGKQIPVSRIGMSREHAESIRKLLDNCLTPPKPKQLNPPTDNSTKQ